MVAMKITVVATELTILRLLAGLYLLAEMEQKLGDDEAARITRVLRQQLKDGWDKVTP